MLTFQLVIAMSEIVTMSSKGQIVVPKELREELKIDSGTNFVIFGKDGTLILKKIDVPKSTNGELNWQRKKTGKRKIS